MKSEAPSPATVPIEPLRPESPEFDELAVPERLAHRAVAEVLDGGTSTDNSIFAARVLSNIVNLARHDRRDTDVRDGAIAAASQLGVEFTSKAARTAIALHKFRNR